MGNLVFPNLPGLKWDSEKTPIFSTRIQTAVSGREYAASFFLYPLYQFDLSYEVLRDDLANNELKQIMGLYLQCRGAWDSFLYIDPSDNKVTGQFIGAGDGGTLTFQLQRAYGGWIDLCTDIQPRATATPIEVYLGVTPPVKQDHAAYSVDLTTGIVTFNSAPALNVAISADFSFYYRVRFLEFAPSDTPGAAGSAWCEFMYNLWELKSVSFRTRR